MLKHSIFALTLFSAHIIASENASQIIVNLTNRNAVSYVGTTPTSGKMQFELLRLEGLKKEDHVLEIGCGALVASIPIISYLEKGHFVGIDPNVWLRKATLSVRENKSILGKEPTFLSNEVFDASSTGLQFDYIISHSIMSHAAHWQLPIFLENCAKVLKKGGKVLFSLRLTKPNAYGHKGSKKESLENMWQYPGVSYFHKETVEREALKWFSNVEEKIEFTRLITSANKHECHDWIVLTK